MSGSVSHGDRVWMRRALRLAARGWGRTWPNPMVGAVVVRDGVAVGAGWHHRAGTPHAEVHALRAAGDAARGATLYVTLEPCCTHGRTPPCTAAVGAAGIRRCVVAMADPNPVHAGRGLDVLREAGIEVVCGVEEETARQLNEAFACRICSGRPFVLLKMAMTLDGKIATAGGQSQWITGPRARARVQRWRRWADAVLVGAETVRRDNPQLLVRQPPGWQPQPQRIIVSSSGDLGDRPRVLHDGAAPTRVVAPADAAAWRALLAELGSADVTALLVEGGGETAAAMLRADVVDKVAFFVAPRLLGGRGSRPVLGGPDPDSLDAALPLQRTRLERVGNDILITGYLHDVYRHC